MTRDTAEPAAASAAPATLDDVARRAGVSAATASRALGGGPHVASATRERVLAAAADLDYVASPEAARLAGGQGGLTGRVAVLVPHPSRWFFGELLEGLEGELRAAGLDLLLFGVGDPDARRLFFERLPARRKVDAVVVLAVRVDDDEQRRLSSLGVHIVAVGGGASSYPSSYPSVGVDDHAAARRAVDHLVHLGHRRIGMIAHDDGVRPVAQECGRVAGYRDAVREGDAEVDDELVVRVGWGGDGGADGVAHLLGLRRPPTAVFAWCDEIALGALRAVRLAGLRVPADVSVVGVDDHPVAATVDLTTVAQPVREQGRLAGALLRTALRDDAGPVEGDATGGPTRLALPTRLVLRGTTAPPGRWLTPRE